MATSGDRESGSDGFDSFPMSSDNMNQCSTSRHDRDYHIIRKLTQLELEQKELKETVARQQNKIDDQQQKINDLTKSIENQRANGAMAFTARVKSSLTNLGAGQTIIFEDVLTNAGGAYNNNTGIFTAPLKGVYVFNYAAMVNKDQNEYLELVKDGSHLLWNYPHAMGSNHLVSASRTATVELDQGNCVWIRTQNNSSHGTGYVHVLSSNGTIAFTAVISPPNLSGLGSGQTIIFDQVITNVGSAYNNLTGIFLAPVKGVYVFNHASMMEAGKNEYTELVKMASG